MAGGRLSGEKIQSTRVGWLGEVGFMHVIPRLQGKPPLRSLRSATRANNVTYEVPWHAYLGFPSSFVGKVCMHSIFSPVLSVQPSLGFRDRPPASQCVHVISARLLDLACPSAK